MGIIALAGRSSRLYVSGGGAAPSYTPILLRSFDGGTAGAQLTTGGTGFFAVPNTRGTFISNTGPYGTASSVGETGFTAQDQSTFGGDIYNGSDSVVDGDDLWIRIWEWFPSSWDFGYSSNNPTGDGWGHTKWLRQTLNGERGTWQTSNAGKCSGMTDEFGSASNIFYNAAGITAIPKNQWVCREYQTHFDNNASNGFIRYWQDEVYQGQVNGQTKPAGTCTIDEIIVGDYYNGGSPQAQKFRLAECIGTLQTPDAVDGSGRAMIGMARKVSEFV